MKKYVLFFLSMFCANVIYSQIHYTSYSLKKTKDANWGVLVELSKKNDAIQYIESPSKDDRTVSILLTEKENRNFIAALKKVQQKYTEWMTTVQKEGVKEVDKRMSVNFPTCKAQFKYTVLYPVKKMKMEARFLVKNGECCVVVQNSSKLRAKGNKWIQAQGFELNFSNSQELEKFMQTINFEMAQKVLQEKKNTENKFE